MAHRKNQVAYFLHYAQSILNPHEYSNTPERFTQARVLNFLRSVKSISDRNLGSSIVEAGSVESVLILFVDIVRKAHESATLHSLAFSVLVKMCQTNQHHLNYFMNDLNGLELVEFILNHSKCVVSIPLLDHYFDLCLVKRGQYSLIKSAKLFYYLLNCWRAWHKETKVARHFYRKLTCLLRLSDSAKSLQPQDRSLESSYVDHNFRMMTQAGSMDILLGILSACLVATGQQVARINHELIGMIVNLIALLIKHPPSLDVISDIMEFLTFLHPDPEAYIDAPTDSMSYLHLIQIDKQDAAVPEPEVSRLTTSPVDSLASSDHTSRDSIAENSAESSSHETMITFSSTCESKDRESAEVDWFKNQSGVDLRTVTGNFASLDGVAVQRRKAQYLSGGQKVSDGIPDEGLMCSNRSFAIACLTDVIASIVKLSSSDPMKILSRALEKPIIDTQRLVILANNESQFVREKVLRLFLYSIRACYSLNLSSILERHEEEAKGSVYKICTPIQLMASQLSSYPTSMQMIQLCYGIIVGIEDFETVEKVCVVFDIETIDNNLQLNTLILLIRLITQLQDSKDVISSLEFVHTCMKKLLESNKSDILAVIVKGNLVESLFRLYFSYVEREIKQCPRPIQTFELYNHDENEYKSDCCKVRANLDKVLILVVRYYLQDLPTGDAIQSIGDLLLCLDLMNSYIPAELQFLLRDRKVKVLTAALNYCEHYQDCAKHRHCGGKFQYYLKSLFTTTPMNVFPNVIPNYRLDRESIFTNSVERDEPADADNDSGDISIDSVTPNKTNEFDVFSLGGSGSSESRKSLNEKDVIERHRSIIGYSVDFITNREPEVIPSPLERKFIIKCIEMLSGNLLELDKSSGCSDSQWSLILPKLERSLRVNFARMVLYLLSPCDSMSLDERKYYALKLLEMFSVDQLLSLLYSSDLTPYMILNAFVKDLIGEESSMFDSDDEENSDREELMDNDTEVNMRILLTRIEHALGRTPKFRTHTSYSYKSWMRFPNSESEARFDSKFKDIWIAELNQAREDNYERLLALRADAQNPERRSTSILSDNVKRVHDEALAITRQVVEEKRKQRKAYLEAVKHYKVYIHIIRQQWLSLIVGNGHEKAIRSWIAKNVCQ